MSFRLFSSFFFLPLLILCPSLCRDCARYPFFCVCSFSSVLYLFFFYPSHTVLLLPFVAYRYSPFSSLLASKEDVDHHSFIVGFLLNPPSIFTRFFIHTSYLPVVSRFISFHTGSLSRFISFHTGSLAFYLSTDSLTHPLFLFFLYIGVPASTAGLFLFFLSFLDWAPGAAYFSFSHGLESGGDGKAESPSSLGFHGDGRSIYRYGGTEVHSLPIRAAGFRGTSKRGSVGRSVGWWSRCYSTVRNHGGHYFRIPHCSCSWVGGVFLSCNGPKT